VVRSAVPRLNLDDVFLEKEEIALNIKDELTKSMGSFGFVIIQVSGEAGCSSTIPCRTNAADDAVNEIMSPACTCTTAPWKCHKKAAAPIHSDRCAMCTFPPKLCPHAPMSCSCFAVSCRSSDLVAVHLA
jgi:hypothetical protein